MKVVVLGVKTLSGGIRIQVRTIDARQQHEHGTASGISCAGRTNNLCGRHLSRGLVDRWRNIHRVNNNIKNYILWSTHLPRLHHLVELVEPSVLPKYLSVIVFRSDRSMERIPCNQEIH